MTVTASAPATCLPMDAQTRAMFDDTLDRFVDEHYTPAARLARLKKRPTDYRTHWAALAELGILGAGLPEALGGLGGSAADVAHTSRVLSRGLLLEPLVESAVVAGTVLASADCHTQQREQVNALVSGEQITLLIGGKPAKTGLLRCDRQGDGYVLSGSLPLAPFVQQADRWLVAARDGASDEAVVFNIAPHAPAWGTGSYRLLDGTPACDVTFDYHPVPASGLWLRGAAADAALERAALLGTAAWCAEAAGIMTQLVTITGAYLTTRVQFGVTLSNFQALQHRFADMHMEALECGALARAFAAAIDRVDADQLARLRAALPHVMARGPARVGQEAIQMHGGMGLTEELVVSHYNARLLVLASLVAAWTPPSASRIPGARA